MVDKEDGVNKYTAMQHTSITPDLWTTRLNFTRILSGDLPERLSEALEDLAVSVFLHNRESADGDNWTVTLTTIGKPDAASICARVNEVETGLLTEKDVLSEKLPPKDWLQHVHDNFPPVQIGHFFVYGSHYKGEIPKDSVPLQIDAATAFGSGEHETTRGCIQALEFLKARGCRFRNGLDMGCGSGILAIAQVKLWPDLRALAIDIDPESVIVTKRHAEMNRVSDKITAEAGDGYNALLVAARGPYDVVTANILANPLIVMAPALHGVLGPGGYAILSGLLRRQKADVLAAHEALGLKLIHAEEIGEWQALVLQK